MKPNLKSNMPYVLHINNILNTSKDLVGSKAALTGEMKKLGLPVPDTCVVTCSCYERFVQETGIKNTILTKLSSLNSSDIAGLQTTSLELQTLIANTEMPKSMSEEILKAYNSIINNVDLDIKENPGLAKKIKRQKATHPIVSVKSSMFAKKLPNTVFSGQQSSFLNVTGDEHLLKAVKVCWAALYTPRAIVFRQRNNIGHTDISIAIIIQDMINAATSGVVYTANTTTNNSGQAVVEAIYGIGEAIFSGSVKPDTYFVDKSSNKLAAIDIQEQEWQIRRDQDGNTTKKTVPLKQRKGRVLDDAMVLRLVQLAVKLEKSLGHAQSVEWAEENGKPYILNARPIMLLSKKPK